MNTRFYLFLCLQNNLQMLAVQYFLEFQDSLFSLLLPLPACMQQEEKAVSLVLYLLVGHTLLNIIPHYFPVSCFEIVRCLSHEKSFVTLKNSDWAIPENIHIPLPMDDTELGT